VLPTFAASSASLALSLIHCCLSFLQFFLTSLSFCLYSSVTLAASPPVLAICSFFAFISLLSSMDFHVRSVIHLSFFVPRLLPITDSAVWLIVSLMFSHSSSTSTYCITVLCRLYNLAFWLQFLINLLTYLQYCVCLSSVCYVMYCG